MLSIIKKATSGKKFLAILLLFGLIFAVGCANAPTKGWSGPVISNNVLYVGTIKGKIIALDATTGELKSWEKDVEKQSSSAFSCGRGISTPMSIYGTPVIKGDVVYIAGYDGKIYAVNINGFSSEPYDTGGAIVGSPVIDGDTLYVGNSDGKLFALSTDDINNPKWDEPFKTGGKIWSTPVISDGVVYVGSSNHKLYAIDAVSGKEIWHFKAGAGILSTPLVSDGMVYIGACDDKFYAIQAATDEDKQAAADRGEGVSAPERTAKQVCDKAGNWFWTTALVYNGWIYVGNLDHNLYAINVDDFSNAIAIVKTGGRIMTPPIEVNGQIIIGSEDGWIYAIDPTNKTSKKLGENREAPIFAPIVPGSITVTVGDDPIDVIYVHAQNGSHKLYAINTETGSVVWDYKTS